MWHTISQAVSASARIMRESAVTRRWIDKRDLAQDKNRRVTGPTGFKQFRRCNGAVMFIPTAQGC